MEAVITIVVVGTLFIVWFGCGYQATRALLRKGYGAAPIWTASRRAHSSGTPSHAGRSLGPAPIRWCFHV